MGSLIRWLGIALSIIILNGCMAIPSPNIAVADFGALNQSELVTLEAGDKTFAFTARLESDGQKLTLVAITPTGQRLFSLYKQGEQLTSEAGPLWPKEMPLSAVWDDFEMAHAPAHAGLAKDWQQIVISDEAGVQTRLWRYRGGDVATVKVEANRVTLIKSAYRLSLEVLAE